ncbi:MAG: hypothetical protein GY765_11145 [bacterium]|nr:hypothetical protein [bacterium]
MKLLITCWFSFVLCFISFGTDKKMSPVAKNMLEADRLLSKSAQAKGILEAFREVAAGYTVLLPNGSRPIQGKQALEVIIAANKKNGVPIMKRQWEPLGAEVSKAGDLGFTYGRFLPTSAQQDTQPPAYRYYSNFWRKHTDGSWKIALGQGLLTMEGLELKPLENRLNRSKADAVTLEVIDTELAFCKHAAEKGISKAFYFYMAENGMVLGSGGAPVTKAAYARAIEAAAKQTNRSKTSLVWEPFFSFVSTSGDLAYNYGPYVLTTYDAEGKASKRYGCFATIWKLQADKTWRFLVDGGNQGPSPL